MKKFLAALIAVFVITFSFTTTEAAVDVPGFPQFTGYNFKFTGREDGSHRVYGYDCSVDVKEHFAEEFVDAMIKDYDFKLVGHFFNDYIKTSVQTFESWVLVYTGYKNARKFEHRDYSKQKPYYGHLVVVRHKNWIRETTHFSIKVAYGLTYGDD